MGFEPESGMVRFRRQDLIGAELVWLLTVEWSGITMRWSTRPITVTIDGVEVTFDGGLDAEEVSDALSFMSEAADAPTASFELLWPVDVALWVSRGADLSTARGELALHRVGASWSERRVVVQGNVSRPEYGASYEPVGFTLERRPHDDRGVFPPFEARISDTTWPDVSSQAPELLGRVYPWVFGTAGTWSQGGTTFSRPGSPAYPVEWTAGNVDTLLLCGATVKASSGRLWYRTTTGALASTSPVTITHQADGLGRSCAVADISGASLSIRQAEEFYWTWSDPAAVGVASEAGIEGLGDLVATVLERATVDIDRGRWGAAIERMNAVRVAGYIDEQVVPYEWVVDNALPLFPIALRAGPRGIAPVIWRFDATADEAVEHLEVETGVDRVGPVQYVRPPSEVVNALYMAYGLNAETGEHMRRSALVPKPTEADPEQSSSSAVASSLARYGQERSQSLDTDIVFDRASVEAVLAWRAMALGFCRRVVTYDVGLEYAWLEVGDVLTLSDADLHLESATVLVDRIDWGVGPSLRITLELLEQLA